MLFSCESQIKGTVLVIFSTRRIALAATTLLFYLPQTFSKPARVASNEQHLLLQLEQRWLESEDSPDALQTILADDFIHVLPFGFVTKNEQLRYMRAHPTPQRETRRHLEDVRVRIFG